MAPDEVSSKIAELDYAVPIMGALAGNPKVTRKDVIKAAADAQGANKIDAAQAIALISQIPDDPKKVQPWLRQMYAANLTALVHLKAAAGPQAAPQPQPTPELGTPQ
jgi:hypothetical protein